MNKFKTLFTTVFTALAGWLGILAIPLIILFFMNLVDYGTGLVASKYRNEEINSYKSFWGIVKKICMWLLIFIGALMDWLIVSTGESVGFKIPIVFIFAIGTAVWLICNEFISILENMKDIGVKIPPFLQPLAKNIKKQVEDKAKIGDDANG